MRFGTVAIIGRSNVGKSTFLNAALGEGLAIVSPRPQTTRDALLGVLTTEDTQIAFVDTPGLHKPKTELGRRMNAVALDTLRGADAIVFMTDDRALVAPPVRGDADAPDLLPEDADLISQLPEKTPCIAVVNKVDRIKQKHRLLPLLQALSAAHPFAAFVPATVLKETDVRTILEELVAVLPEGGAAYDADSLTDRPMVFFAREYIREQVLLSFEREVPHAVAVSIERFEASKRVTVIQATIHVEKAGQRAILVGKGGSALRQVGIGARQRIETLLGGKVHLELFVRVSPRWKDMPRQLAELGYSPSASPAVDLAPERAEPEEDAT